jgi:type IV pilus assembly protein PilC
MATDLELLDDTGMREYAYEAISATTGRTTSATMTAPSEQAVAVALQESGWFPVSIEPVSSSRWNVDINQLLRRPTRMKVRALAYLTARLQRLLAAGVSIPSAFTSLAEDAPPDVARVLSDIASQVTSGIPLSEAMAKHPTLFNRVYTAYVSAGESTGQLAVSLERLSVMLAKQAELQGKVKAVMTYPALISSAIGLLVLGLIRFLIPRFAAIYADFGAELPTPTRVVVALSEVLSPITTLRLELLPIPIPVPELRSPTLWALVLFFGVRRFLASRRDDLEFGRRFDRFRYRIPVFGNLWKMMGLSRWASTLAGALAAGVRMTDGVMLAAEASGSRWHMLVAKRLADAIQSGRPMSSELRQHRDLFPTEILTMVETGEQTGGVDGMLDVISAAMDAEIAVTTETMSAKIEVALLITMGLVVGGLLAVVYMPILNLTSAMMSNVGA